MCNSCWRSFNARKDNSLTGHHFLLPQRAYPFSAPGNRDFCGPAAGLVCTLHPQRKAHKRAVLNVQGSGKKKPCTLACGPVRLFDVKKKPLSRINGERKKSMSGAGLSGKWERGEVNVDHACIVCLSPCKPMMIVRLFKDWLIWNCVQIDKIIHANLPKVKIWSASAHPPSH